MKTKILLRKDSITYREIKSVCTFQPASEKGERASSLLLKAVCRTDDLHDV